MPNDVRKGKFVAIDNSTDRINDAAPYQEPEAISRQQLPQGIDGKKNNPPHNDVEDCRTSGYRVPPWQIDGCYNNS